jgi:hypothetical protein
MEPCFPKNPKEAIINGFAKAEKAFIDKIYNMPKEQFIQNVLENSMPELEKLPILDEKSFPIPTDINFEYKMDRPVLRRQCAEIPTEFDKWLYKFRYMLQYFTVEEMFNIFNTNYTIYNNYFGISVNFTEPNAWIDDALEQMYISSSEETTNTSENVEEFEFNLEWDIEKGNFNNIKSTKLSLYLPEQVGMHEEYDDAGNTLKTNKKT